MKKTISFIIILIVVFIAGMLLQHYWRSDSSVVKGDLKKRQILYWVSPMNQNYRRDKPGKSPMGMDLVPVYADDDNGKDQKSIKISPNVENNLGIKTAQVKRMDLSRIIDTVGHVVADENRIEQVHTYTDGWIKVLNVKTMGEQVAKGQLLLQLYSPELNNAQEELLLALKYNNASLIRAGEQKLLTLGMAQQQINRLKSTRRVMKLVKIYATQGGIVSQLNVREGNYVKPDTDLMTIEDLSHIWMIAEVFERQASWVKAGQPAIATLPYLPDKTWQGHVDYVYPELDPKTHTLRVRLTFPNPDLAIKPKMYADIKIFSQTIKDALVIPRLALIRVGSEDRVIIALGKGRFQSRRIQVGIESGDYYQVRSGLTTDDVVVTSAQFLIDSESNLKAGLSRVQSHDKANTSKSTSSNQNPRKFAGTGQVLKLNTKKRVVVLRNQPIPAFNMPAMTMSLSIDKAVALTRVKVGDVINFVIVKEARGAYLVTKIQITSTKKALGE